MTFDELKLIYYNKIPHCPFFYEKRHKAHFSDDLKYSDIVLHLPVIEWFASKCDVAVEFGVREGNSSIALLSGINKKLYSFDIERPSIVDVFKTLTWDTPQSVKQGVKWEFIKADSIAQETVDLVPECDLMMFDTLHTYDQLSKELKLHAHKAKRFLIFHDTYTSGEFDLSGPNKEAIGILPAIKEFKLKALDCGDDWITVYETKANNGLIVLEKY